ncbi:proteasome-activating nucleotidase [Slackia heliotrinireducens]|uniref:AAA+ family ATPase n=1 Tax=Slackia heliotrinireducens (strain ATCC 29202 / DSM 20476 / NCTC 11029 / RHS 1) TaxID=471855 RepID=C7N293_SLAHD|nr:AAA family ATPase [Slackia heliotrinireducens]ACV21399.1 AAA+ family ATPase [Slackia heliotrinireducens DSM 20476]VEG98832.1 proteasome-activating nucleotidase [Slackia heliotrinireducens]
MATYYVGSVRLPADVDWADVAKCIGLVLSLGLPVEVGQAKQAENGFVLGIVVKEPDPRSKPDTPSADDLKEALEHNGYKAELRNVPLGVLAGQGRQVVDALTRLGDSSRLRRSVSAADVAPAAPTGDIGSSFDGLVGLAEVREGITAVVKAVSRFGRGSLSSLGTVLLGPPGTGKTEIARRMAAAYGQAGVSTGKFTQADASQLISEYVGETPTKVRSVFDSARGGVLLIDEAYRLSSADAHSGSHAREALHAINQLTEERRSDTIVVLAGYRDETMDLLSQNPGLKSRFPIKYELTGYSAVEQRAIFSLMAEQRGFNDRVDEPVFLSAVDKLSQKDGFAQARTMRNLVDKCVLSLARQDSVSFEIDNGAFVSAVSEVSHELDVSSTRRRIGFV